MSEAVERILANYAGENPGVIGNLRRLMMTGELAGTGKLVILPVDQGFEHGPARSFAPNPEGYDPAYHPKLAVETGCSGYAAPLGFIESIAGQYAGQLPLILKVNNSDSLSGGEPCSALTSSVKDALRLGCSAIGFTIYPGSGLRNDMFLQLRDLIREARDAGLPSIVWSYARGGKMTKVGETAIDTIAYSAHMAAELGAHVIKVKPPTDDIYLDAARKSYEGIPTSTLEERIRHVVQAAFNGKRIVIFSGGAAKGTEAVLEEIKSLHAGGGYGSIVGRNAFQRSPADGAKLLRDIMAIYKS